MTVGEYLTDTLKPLELGASALANFTGSTGLSLMDEYDASNHQVIMLSAIDLLEMEMLKPRLESINESGFSISYNYADLGKLYLFLCRKYGRKPLDAITDTLGIATIKDKTSIW